MKSRRYSSEALLLVVVVLVAVLLALPGRAAIAAGAPAPAAGPAASTPTAAAAPAPSVAPTSSPSSATPASSAGPAAATATSSAARDTQPPAVTILLPAPKAAEVDPKRVRISLLLSEPMAEPPAGTLTVEILDGTTWKPTAHTARGDYIARTREWKWRLTPATLPESAELRLTLKPTAGKDSAGNALPTTPIVWTFRTGIGGALSQVDGDKGGCPTGAERKSEAPPPAPCTKP